MGRGGKKTDLQGLVLGSVLHEEEKQEKPTSHILVSYEEHATPHVVSNGRDLEVLLANNPAKEEVLDKVAEQAALYLSLKSEAPQVKFKFRAEADLPVFSRHHPGTELSLLLLEYLQSPSEEARKEVLEEMSFFVFLLNNQIEMRYLTKSTERELDYIQDYFEEDSAHILSEVTRTKESTVRKWLEGSNPSSHNSSRISILVKILYQAHAGMRLRKDEVLDWYLGANPAFSGQSPHDILKDDSAYWTVPPEIVKEMSKNNARF